MSFKLETFNQNRMKEKNVLIVPLIYKLFIIFKAIYIRLNVLSIYEKRNSFSYSEILMEHPFVVLTKVIPVGEFYLLEDFFYIDSDLNRGIDIVVRIRLPTLNIVVDSDVKPYSFGIKNTCFVGFFDI